MVEVGFAAENLGSVWNFVPDVARVGLGQPIQFHEPHGKASGKMSFRVAKGTGRRLGRRYGWSVETFKAKQFF